MYDGRLNEKVNEDNINLAIAAVKAALGKDAKVEYEKLEDGSFIIKVNGEDFFQVDDTVKIGDVVTAMSYLTGNVSPTETQSKNKTPSFTLTNLNKISINLSIADEIQAAYATSLTKFSEYQSHTTKMRNTIREKLRAFYMRLGDKTEERFAALEQYIRSLSDVIKTCLYMYITKDDNDFKKLEELCEYLWGSLDENYKTTKQEIEYSLDSILSFGTITPEEYSTIMADSDLYFDQYYDIIVSDFESRMNLQYQVFLSETIPKVLNIVVEAEYDMASSKDNYSLENFKNDISTNILEKYGKLENIKIDELGIPTNIWNAKSSNYEKALLLISYTHNGNIKELKNDFNDAVNKTIDNNSFEHKSREIVYGYNHPFDLLDELSGLFKYDENTTPQEIMQKYQQYTSKINDIYTGKAGSLHMYDYLDLVSMINTDLSDIYLSNNALGTNDERYVNINELWYQTLVENGYQEELKNYNIENAYENIYHVTFTNDFFRNIVTKNGSEQLDKILNCYYGKIKDAYHLSNEDDPNRWNLSNDVIREFSRQTECKNIFGNFATSIYSDFTRDKIIVDNSKSSFKLALAESVDTSNVTDEDIENAKRYYYPNGDSKYLED